jgi:hypothetical protein
MDAGIADQHVNASELLAAQLQSPLPLGLIRDVVMYEHCPLTRLCGKSLAGLPVNIRQQQAAALRDNPPGVGLAHAAGGSGK